MRERGRKGEKENRSLHCVATEHIMTEKKLYLKNLLCIFIFQSIAGHGPKFGWKALSKQFSKMFSSV